MLCLRYFYNIFTTNLSGKLLSIIIGGNESNFSDRLKLESITTKHL